MNRRSRVTCLALSVVLSSPAWAQTLVSPAFTYQGRLNFGGVPVNGTYDFTFRLYDALVGGVSYGVVTVNDLSVSDGLFTTSINFGSGAFSADARWLQIEVRPGASTGSYTVLTPREEFTGTPWAHAIRLPYGGQLNSASTAFNLSQLGTGKVAQFNGSTTATAAALNASSTSTSSSGHAAAFTKTGNGGASAINVAASNGGEGLYVQYDDTVDGGSAIYSISNSPTGTAITSLTSNGTDNIWAANLGGTGDCIFAQQGGLFGVSGMGRAGYFAQNVSANPSDAVEIEQDGTGDGLYVHMDNTSASGIGVNVLNTGLSRAGRFETNNANCNLTALLATTNGSGGGVGATNTGTGRAGIFQITNASNSSAALYCSTTGTGPAFQADGLARVDILEITGADVAEKFPASEEMKPGMVAAIDADNPGKLCLSRGAYNRRVAGVVSGAGDVPVGAILGNLPASENGPPIALSGRVWVMCDASDRAIEPGDLLTTSDTPGHAMTATDDERSHGAIIGKAMTALKQGERGQVLVLVNLQ